MVANPAAWARAQSPVASTTMPGRNSMRSEAQATSTEVMYPPARCAVKARAWKRISTPAAATISCKKKAHNSKSYARRSASGSYSAMRLCWAKVSTRRAKGALTRRLSPQKPATPPAVPWPPKTLAGSTMATVVAGVLAASAAKVPAMPPPRTKVSIGRVMGIGASVCWREWE